MDHMPQNATRPQPLPASCQEQKIYRQHLFQKLTDLDAAAAGTSSTVRSRKVVSLGLWDLLHFHTCLVIHRSTLSAKGAAHSLEIMWELWKPGRSFSSSSSSVSAQSIKGDAKQRSNRAGWVLSFTLLRVWRITELLLSRPPKHYSLKEKIEQSSGSTPPALCSYCSTMLGTRSKILLWQLVCTLCGRNECPCWKVVQVVLFMSLQEGLES